jgi:hypothetical protein
MNKTLFKTFLQLLIERMIKIVLILSIYERMRKLKGVDYKRSRGAVPGGAGDAMEPPDFGRLCPPNNTGTAGFSDLPTALWSPL